MVKKSFNKVRDEGLVSVNEGVHFSRLEGFRRACGKHSAGIRLAFPLTWAIFNRSGSSIGTGTFFPTCGMKQQN
jgi:hypothetical protein